jgi:pyruvate dehydrogenase E2 component (dihydrolipoamide acetyltransferase)
VVDATELVALRTRLKEAYAEELGFAIGYNDLLWPTSSPAASSELPLHERRLDADSASAAADEVNMGLAVDTERGLLVPVLRGAHRMGVKEIARRLRELVARAREGQAQARTTSAAARSPSPTWACLASTPLRRSSTCPSAPSWAWAASAPEPAVVDGQVAVRQRLWLSLTFDHRLVDGAPAARFLQAHRPLHRNAVPVAGVGHTTQQAPGAVSARPLAPRDPSRRLPWSRCSGDRGRATKSCDTWAACRRSAACA